MQQLQQKDWISQQSREKQLLKEQEQFKQKYFSPFLIPPIESLMNRPFTSTKNSRKSKKPTRPKGRLC